MTQARQGGDGATVPYAAETATSVLKQLASQASASTKIITTWVVALAAFGFFSVWQGHWKTHQEVGRLSKLKQDAANLRQQAAQQHGSELGGLLACRRSAFADITIDLRSETAASESKRSRIRVSEHTIDPCTALELKPSGAASAPASAGATIASKGPVTRSSGASAAQSTAAAPMPENGTVAQHLDHVEPFLRGRRDCKHLTDDEARLAARVTCRQIERKQQESDRLDEQSRTLEASINEVALKAPLFETRVATFLAPLVQLGLLAAGLYYLDRKRREVLAEYVRAARLAGVFDGPHEWAAARIHTFNQDVRTTFGPAPLWLMPFPHAHSLPSGLRVDDTLGGDAGQWSARWRAMAGMALVFFYAVHLFLVATGVDATLLDRSADTRSAASLFDLRFAVALALVWVVGYLALTTVMRWQVPSMPTGGTSQARRNLLIGLTAGYCASLPLAAALSRGHVWLRGKLPRIAWLRRVTNAWLPGRPRLRTRRRWALRWQGASLSDLAAGLVLQTGRPHAAAGRIAYVFPAEFRKDGHRLFGAAWPAARKTGAKTRIEPIEPQRWAAMCKGDASACPKLPPTWLSLSIEVAALDELRGGKIDGALALLGAAIAQSSRSPQGAWKVIRLYDLAAAIAAHHGRRETLARLIADVTLKLANSSAAPAGHVAKFVGARAPLRRRRERSASRTENLAYQSAQWRQRIARWSSVDSAWTKKWRDRAATWKLTVAESEGASRVVQYSLRSG